MKNLTRQSIKNNWFNKLVIIALLLVIPLSPSWAITGTTLKEWGEHYTAAEAGNYTNSMEAGVFMGYVTGVAEATAGIFWCVNDRVVTRKRVFDIIMHAFRTTPPSSYYDKHARVLIIETLNFYYPCHDDSNE